MTQLWGVTDGSEEWEVSVRDGRIVVTQSNGPFGLPVARISLRPESAGSVAKAIVSARNSTRPRKRAAGSADEEQI